MAIALSSSSDENNIAGTSSQISSEIKKGGPSSEMLGGCSVCSDDQGTEENPLVYCDGCEVAVHQACYGIVDVPPGNWFCRKCESSDSQNKMKCELCPSKDGALKKTETGLWAHVVCALYIPEVRFGNNNTMEPIEIKHIQADRYNKSCYLCAESGNSTKASYGAVMDCHKLGCKQSFHVTCAQAAGLLFEEAGQGSDNVIYCGYCKHHFRKLKAGGNRKSTASSLNNNNTSSSYLDSASDSSQDNYSLCNTTEQDKNSSNRNNNNNINKPSSSTTSNLSTTSVTPQPPPTPSPPPTTATTIPVTNSHSPTTPGKTTDTLHNSSSNNNNNNNNSSSSSNNNNVSPISLTIPLKTTSNAKKRSSDPTTSSPQKKRRAPRKNPGTPSTTNNSSTLLASLDNSLAATQPSATSAPFPNAYNVNNSNKLETDASVGDAINNNNNKSSLLMMNDAVPSISSSAAAAMAPTTTNSHSPVQTSLSQCRIPDSKLNNNNNSSINLTIPLKSTSRSKKNTSSDSTTSPPEKKKRAPRKKAQGEQPSSNNATSNSSTLLTTTVSLMNSLGSQQAPYPSTYIKKDANASGDSIINNNLSSVPSNLTLNDVSSLPTTTTSTITAAATTSNSHSPAQTTSVSSPSKSKDSKPTSGNSNNPSISLTIPLKSTSSRSRKKAPDSAISPPEKRKRAPRKKAQSGDPSPTIATTNSSTLLATTTGPNNLTNSLAAVNSAATAAAAQPSTAPFFPTTYLTTTSKIETNAPEDIYNWSSANTELNDTQMSNNKNNNNKKKPCVKDDPSRAFEELRENTWSHLSKCVLDQAQQFDIPSLIGTLYTLRSENDKLVNKVRDLTSKRDQLVAMNARLDLPGPMLTQHLNNTSPNFSSVVSGLTNSPKGSPAPSPGSAIGKQSLISVVGSYNHVLPGALGAPGFIDRSSPLMGQPHSSGVNSIKSSNQISTPSPPISALMAHCTSNRTGLIAVNPPYMTNVFPPMNTIGQLGSNPQGSPYYPRQ